MPSGGSPLPFHTSSRTPSGTGWTPSRADSFGTHTVITSLRLTATSHVYDVNGDADPRSASVAYSPLLAPQASLTEKPGRLGRCPRRTPPASAQWAFSR